MPKPLLRALLLVAITTTSGAARTGAPWIDDGSLDEDLAFALSGSATLASVGVIAVGGLATRFPAVEDLGTAAIIGGSLCFLAAPSVGHWYVGDVGTPGLYLRIGGVAGLVAGYALVTSRSEDEPNEHGTATTVLFITSASAVLAGTIWDIASADNAARAHNEKLQLSPTALTTPTGMVGGLALSARF